MLALLDVSNTAYGNAMACVCVQRDTRRISAQKIRFLRENHCVAAARNACRSAAPSLIWRWISTARFVVDFTVNSEQLHRRSVNSQGDGIGDYGGSYMGHSHCLKIPSTTVVVDLCLL
jgi:hypothetical protein